MVRPFELWYKGELVSIYDITYDKNGYPRFLIYHDKQWRRVSAKHFNPQADWTESEDD